MPRQLQTDRWMFGSTLALCLVGAIMVFSASAVTARDQYGNGSHFLLRQLLWLAFGLGAMMAVMNLDYRKLRKPQVIFSVLVGVLLMLAGVFFLDKSHATHRWIRTRSGQSAAFRTRQAGRNFLPGMVSGNAPAARRLRNE